MRIHRDRTPSHGIMLVAVMLAACGGDSTEAKDDDETTAASTEGSPETGTTAPSDDGESTTSESSGGTTGGESTESGSTGEKILPEVLSLTGCDQLGLGPLCSVAEESDGSFRANCSGIHYEGQVTENGEVTMTAEPRKDASGATVEMTCDGRFARGQLTADCKQTISNPASQETCELVSDTLVLPSVTCLELPSTFDDFVICSEGDAQGGSTIEGGSCRVIQDGCVFQAECADDVTLTGTVSRTGISFRQQLTALADAQTPEGGSPAFLQGDLVAHTCTGTLEGSTITGSCAAGRVGRNGADTSVCNNRGTYVPVPTCDLIAPSTEHVFVLDPCEILEFGEGGTPGIGQPVCAYRQNNCIWEVRCGTNPDLVFTNRLEQDSRTVAWRLATGTPCEATFDDQGNATGNCTVPGETPCQLESITAVPGGDTCPVLPAGTGFHTHGCGGPSAECTAALQHGCNFMATCTFGPTNDLVIAGEASFVAERAHLDFNGLAAYACYVDQATADEIESGDRAPNEWYGDCVNGDNGGTCRNNYNPETGEGFRALRLYFDE